MEEVGEGSMYSMLQPDIIPILDEPVDTKERVDVLCRMTVQVGKNPFLGWCQGRVEGKVKGRMLKNQEVPTVMIQWNGIPDITRWENRGPHGGELSENLFNRDKEGALRLDVDLAPIWRGSNDVDSLVRRDGQSDDDGVSDGNSTDGDVASVFSESDSSDFGVSDSDTDSE